MRRYAARRPTMHVPGADCARLINGLPCPAWGIHNNTGTGKEKQCAGLAGWDNTISAGGEQQVKGGCVGLVGWDKAINARRKNTGLD